MGGKREKGNRWGNASRRMGKGWWRIRAIHLQAEPYCRICRAQGKLIRAVTVDHIKPRVMGGTDETNNLQSLCESHAQAKNALDAHGKGHELMQRAATLYGSQLQDAAIPVVVSPPLRASHAGVAAAVSGVVRREERASGDGNRGGMQSDGSAVPPLPSAGKAHPGAS